MNKIVAVLQRILRLIMLVVAILMLGAGIFLIGVHMANKNLPKTAVTGQIVAGDDLRAIHEVRYQWEGKTIERRPLDIYFRKLGNIGDKMTVYVANDHPYRVFTSQRGDDLVRTAGFMGGWSLLLFIILLGERQLMTRMDTLEELVEEEKEEDQNKSENK